jgi:S-adenosylmethionine:tRNA ribosyltransferase-isomerase
VLVSDFNYFLPDELIAKEPLADRAASRLLHLRRDSGILQDRQFRDFPDLLRTDDLVVFNNTKVLPARLFGRRSGVKAQAVNSRNPASRGFLKGNVEVLLTRQISSDRNEWECLVRPGRKIGIGERLFFGEEEENELQAEVLAWGSFGEKTIRFIPVEDFVGTLDRLGHVPLPPYIKRSDREDDRERYQTIYARERGSVAAPTAGLHFTSEILARIRERGVETVEITLHVGLGTFQPVRARNVEQHRLHSEGYFISDEVAARINCAMERSRRVIAIGTTTVRTLEDSAQRSGTGQMRAGSGDAEIFIYPEHKFQIVGALLTNFHLPQSTLLMLVSAFAGKETVLQAYRHAVEKKYRFYSYGDCMFIE